MLLAYIVYFSVLLVVPLLMSLSVYPSNKQMGRINNTIFGVDKFIQEILPIVLLTLILGLRYNVGVDYLSYEDIFRYQESTYSIADSHIEPLYFLLNHIVYKLGCPYYILTCLIMFISFVLFWGSFKPYPSLRKLSFVFLFLSGLMFMYFNLQRQAISCFIFIYSLKFVYERKLYMYILCVLIASGFHYSSIILLPLYFMYSASVQKTFWDNVYLQLLAFVFCFIFKTYVFDLLLSMILQIAPAKYLGYAGLIVDWDMDLGTGYGMILYHLMDFITIIILFSIYKCQKESNPIILFLHRIWFVGACLEIAFEGNMLLSRLPLYMVSVKIILLAYIVINILNRVLRKKSATFIFSAMLLLMYFVYFTLLILNGSSLCSPYQFVGLHFAFYSV